MDKYNKLFQIVGIMSSEQVIEVLVNTFGKEWFRVELLEWLANCNDEELDDMEKVINSVKDIDNE